MKFSELVASKEDFEKVVLDPEGFIKERGLSGETELQVLNISSIMNDALEVNPVSLSDLSDTYAGKLPEIDSKLHASGDAKQGFQNFINRFTNIAARVITDTIGLDSSKIRLDAIRPQSKLVK